MPFFIEFLKASGLFDQWVEDCPLHCQQERATKRDVLGTLVLSVLAGYWRYAHISAIRGDGINPIAGYERSSERGFGAPGYESHGETAEVENG